MKPKPILYLLSFWVLFCECQSPAQPQLIVIPKPEQYEVKGGTFEFDDKTTIIISNEILDPLAGLLVRYVKPEFFHTKMEKGTYPFVIRCYYRHIQNQLGILFRKEGDEVYRHFEDLVLPLE